MNKVHQVVRLVRNTISSSARQVIRNGGSFDEVRNNVVGRLTKRYPGLDAGTLYGGFDHEYVQALQKRVA